MSVVELVRTRFEVEFRVVLTLQSNLDQLEGHNDESLGGTSGCAGQDGERLVHLGDAEHVPVELAPLVVGSELGGALGSLHEDGS